MWQFSNKKFQKHPRFSCSDREGGRIIRLGSKKSDSGRWEFRKVMSAKETMKKKVIFSLVFRNFGRIMIMGILLTPKLRFRVIQAKFVECMRN